ncbi:ribonuclease Oy [Phlebotomus argentipes]|uniref:ribonuclease Oy n=1 Tax=Phlebotomus argentipes TaxID=94469 RepID=UPI0028930388|nr:ribonuclease Oy [Phlebotomus argentipes]
MRTLTGCCFGVGCFLLAGFLAVTVRATSDEHPWDVLIFTQQWPQTVCHQWKSFDKRHKCLLPSARNLWTIHGVWPTKYGQKGPAYCNSSLVFNSTEIASIENQLEIFWTNVELKTDHYDFWRHEWEKHGTCASVLPELSNEVRYFSQGLNWLHHYSMSSILAEAKIQPDSSPSVDEIHSAVLSQLKHNPVIHCSYDSSRGENFLEEIRICFSKTLELIDCDGVVELNYPIQEHSEGKIISNCDPTKKILYPSIVPDLEEGLPVARADIDDTAWKLPLVNIYRIIQIVKWATF